MRILGCRPAFAHALYGTLFAGLIGFPNLMRFDTWQGRSAADTVTIGSATPTVQLGDANSYVQRTASTDVRLGIKTANSAARMTVGDASAVERTAWVCDINSCRVGSASGVAPVLASGDGGGFLKLGAGGDNIRIQSGVLDVPNTVDLTIGASSGHVITLTINGSVIGTISSTGLQIAAGKALSIGTGASLSRYLAGSATIDFASITNTTATSNITVTGAVTADACVATAQTLPAGSSLSCVVSASDTVQVRHTCVGTCDPASQTFNVRVFN